MLSLFLLVFPVSAQGDAVPVPHAEGHPWRVGMLLADTNGEAASQRLLTEARPGFELTFVADAQLLTEGTIHLHFDALMVDQEALSTLSQDLVAQIADAYWRSGVVIVGINLKRPEFRRLIGVCGSERADKPVWWEDHDNYWGLSLRTVYSTQLDLREELIGELSGCGPAARDEVAPPNSVIEGNFAAAYFLYDAPEYYDYLFANLEFALDSRERSKLAFLQFASFGPELTANEIAAIMDTNGISPELVDASFGREWRGR